MGYIISMLILGIITGVIFWGAILFRSTSATDEGERAGSVVAAVISALVFWVIFIPVTLATSFHSVDAGHVGVVRTFGDVTDQTGAGLVSIWPWQTLTEVSVKVESYENDNIESFSRETQDVFIKATVNYEVGADFVQELCRSPGCERTKDVEGKPDQPVFIGVLLKPRLLNFLKETTVQYSTVDIAPNREEIRIAVRDKLRADPELAKRSIHIQDLLLDNIDFRQEFKDSIEAKQVATQEALKQQELVKAEEARAAQVVAAAHGAAEALIETARGQAEANNQISSSLTPALIQFQAVQKLSDNVQIALIPSGQGVIIDPTTLFGTAPQ